MKRGPQFADATLTAQEIGRKGGKSASEAKRAASKRNLVKAMQKRQPNALRWKSVDSL